MPLSVLQTINERLERLPPKSVWLIRAASIVGREFSVDVLARMVGEPVLGCLGQLDEAAAAGLVESTATSAEHRFVHVLIRDAIEAGLGTAERVQLHRSAAEAVEELYAGRLEPHLSDLALHWASAAVLGDRGRATGWIRRAADEAVRRLAYEEGVRLYRLALDVGGGELDDLDRCQLLLALGAAQSLSGDHPGRLQTCRSAADLARSMARPDLIAEAALVLDGGDGAEADRLVRRLCEEVLRWLGPQSSSLRARVAAALARSCIYLDIAARHLGLLDDAVADLDKARQACAGNGAAGYHVEALFELAVTLARRAADGDAARARSLAADCASRTRTLGMPPFAARAQELADRLDQALAEPLTPREREVAKLVAHGLTNREIAARLYLSERTAQNHVQHILTKLDLSNRSQIAVWITSRS